MGMLVGLRAAGPETAPAVKGISDRARAEAAARTVGGACAGDGAPQPSPGPAKKTVQPREAA